MPRLILVGGGSSSGKTYVTESIIKALGPDKVTYITLDDYYKDQANMSMEERMKVNYDHPKAFDWPLMRKQIADLKAGKTIEKPTYDFTILTRAKKTERIVPKDLIIAEGIMLHLFKKKVAATETVAADPSSPFVVEMRHISKSFPGIKANDDISLELKRGEIHDDFALWRHTFLAQMVQKETGANRRN